MAINKIVYNNNTLIDLTTDTVTAESLLQGYTAHDRSGTLITGTATGGGGSVSQDQDGFIVLPATGGGSSVGGLEYETGTLEPSSDTYQPIISFTDTHTEYPYFVLVSDVSEEVASQNTVLSWSVQCWDAVFSASVTDGRYTYNGRMQYSYMGSSSLTAGGYTTENTGSGTGNISTYLSNSSFTAYTGNTSRMFRAGRTYKWIAVWAPTT